MWRADWLLSGDGGSKIRMLIVTVTTDSFFLAKVRPGARCGWANKIMLSTSLLSVIPTTVTVWDWVIILEVVPSLKVADPVPEVVAMVSLMGSAVEPEES